MPVLHCSRASWGQLINGTLALVQITVALWGPWTYLVVIFIVSECVIGMHTPGVWQNPHIGSWASGVSDMVGGCWGGVPNLYSLLHKDTKSRAISQSKGNGADWCRRWLFLSCPLHWPLWSLQTPDQILEEDNESPETQPGSCPNYSFHAWWTWFGARLHGSWVLVNVFSNTIRMEDEKQFASTRCVYDCTFTLLYHNSGIITWSKGTWTACAGTTGRKVWSVLFADFCRGNISTIPNFKLPAWLYWKCRFGELYMVTHPHAVYHSIFF